MGHENAEDFLSSFWDLGRKDNGCSWESLRTSYLLIHGAWGRKDGGCSRWDMRTLECSDKARK